MNRLEKRFPELLAYGSNWKLGKIEDDKIPDIYSRSLIGINIHNSIGPVNARLYDLSAFGVCQICDNKKNLHHVFENNSEIIGFDNEKECFELIDYYLNHPTEAMKIGENARQRFLNEYTTANIWLNFFKNLDNFNE
jgi:spore maturation protein CgeB